MLLKHTYSSPIGNIGLLIEDLNLISISLINPVLKGIEAKKDPESFKYIIAQLDEYFFEGRKKFDIAFKISPTNFRLKVYQEMQKIPYGKSITYSDLAGKVGSPKAFRAVGTACGINPLPLIIQCHRVKAQSGLGGFTGCLDILKDFS